MTVEAHAEVFLDLLAGVGKPAAITVCDGEVEPGVLPPYVLVYTSLRVPGADAEPDKSNLTFASLALRARAVCHSVGETAAASRAVATWVRTALLDIRPTVAARTCRPIRWVDGQDIGRDEETGEPVFDLVDVYEYGSSPA